MSDVWLKIVYITDVWHKTSQILPKNSIAQILNDENNMPLPSSSMWQLMHFGIWSMASVFLLYFVCHGSLITSYIKFKFLALLLEHSFGSLVLAIRKLISCAQMQELPQSHCGDTGEVILQLFHISITLLCIIWEFWVSSIT